MSSAPPASRPAVQGLPLHTRSLSVAVKPIAEDRWHARGDVIDLRKKGFVPSSYDLQPSGVVHMMSIEFAFDPGVRVVEDVRVEQPFVAMEPSPDTGGECCRDPAPRLLELAGEPLDEGFTKKLGQRFGGALGCSHLLTLFQLMASAVPRAIDLEQARIAREGTHHRIGERFFRRSLFVDGHEHGPGLTDVAIQLADSHTRPLPEGAPMTERLGLSHEVRTLASVERKRLLIERLEVRERQRTHETLGRAEWIDHAARVAPLLGVRVIPGLAGRIFGLLGDHPALRTVQDNLLQFAPGFIQITAAQMDATLEERARNPDEAGSPTVANLGGNTDSCYMWRRDGAIQRASEAGTARD